MIRDLFLFSGHHASFSLLAIVIEEYFDHCNVSHTLLEKNVPLPPLPWSENQMLELSQSRVLLSI